MTTGTLRTPTFVFHRSNSRPTARGEDVGRRRFLPRAPRALAWGLAFFVVAQVGMIAFMDLRRPELRHPEYGYRLRCLQQRLAEEPDRPLALVLGSSRTQLGFRPDVLPAYRTRDGASPLVFNFGISSTGFVEELVHLRRLLREGIRPSWVFIEVLPSDFCNNLPGLDHYAKAGRTGWQDLPALRSYCASPWKLYQRWAIQSLVPWSSHRFLVLNHYAPGLVAAPERAKHPANKHDRSGWVRWQNGVTPEEHARAFAFAQSQYRQAYEQFFVGGIPDKALRELLTLCKNNQLPVGLFLMPEDDTFRTWYPDAAWRSLHDYLAQLSRDFGVPVLDGRDWVPRADDYLDGHHLLPPGAETFSRRFGSEMIQPFVEGRPVATRLLQPKPRDGAVDPEAERRAADGPR